MSWGLLRRRPWREATYWALDLETSGLNGRRDRILSVGLVPVRDGVIHWGDHWYTVVGGTRPASDDGALGVHQILPGDGRLAPLEREVVERVLDLLDGAVLLAHFCSVELRFLKAAARRHRLRWSGLTVVDTARLLGRLERRMERLQPYPTALPRGLGAARERLGLPAHRAHHALYDALATAELFLLLRSRLHARFLHQLT